MQLNRKRCEYAALRHSPNQRERANGAKERITKSKNNVSQQCHVIAK